MTIGSADGRYLVVNEAFALPDRPHASTSWSASRSPPSPCPRTTRPASSCWPRRRRRARRGSRSTSATSAPTAASSTPGSRPRSCAGRQTRCCTSSPRSPTSPSCGRPSSSPSATRNGYAGSSRSATDAYVSIDPAGLVRDWNPAAVQMFGWTREEAVGVDLAELIIPHGPARRPPAGRRPLPQRAGRPLRRARPSSCAALRRDGAEFPVDLTLWAATESDGEQSFHAFLRDVSGRPRPRSRPAGTRSCSRHSPTASSSPTAPGTVIDTNPAGERLFGRTREELLGAAPSGLLDDRPGMVETVTQAVAAHGSWSDDVASPAPTASAASARRLIKVLPGPNGELQGYLAVHRDVTQNRAAEARLTEAEARWRLVFDSAPIGIALDRPRRLVARHQRRALADHRLLRRRPGRQEIPGHHPPRRPRGRPRPAAPAARRRHRDLPAGQALPARRRARGLGLPDRDAAPRRRRRAAALHRRGRGHHRPAGRGQEPRRVRGALPAAGREQQRRHQPQRPRRHPALRQPLVRAGLRAGAGPPARRPDGRRRAPGRPAGDPRGLEDRSSGAPRPA